MPEATAGKGHVTSRDARGRFTSSGNPLGYRVHNAKSVQLQLEIAKELGGNLSAGEVAPFIVTAENVADRDIGAPRLVEVGNHVRSDKSGPAGDQQHRYCKQG